MPWLCQHCSFRNSDPTRKRCQVCKIKHQQDKVQKCALMADALAQGFPDFHCPICTFLNHTSASSCVMCTANFSKKDKNSPRPSMRSVTTTQKRSTIVLSDSDSDNDNEEKYLFDLAEKHIQDLAEEVVVTAATGTTVSKKYKCLVDGRCCGTVKMMCAYLARNHGAALKQCAEKNVSHHQQQAYRTKNTTSAHASVDRDDTAGTTDRDAQLALEMAWREYDEVVDTSPGSSSSNSSNKVSHKKKRRKKQTGGMTEGTLPPSPLSGTLIPFRSTQYEPQPQPQSHSTAPSSSSSSFSSSSFSSSSSSSSFQAPRSRSKQSLSRPAYAPNQAMFFTSRAPPPPPHSNSYAHAHSRPRSQLVLPQGKSKSAMSTPSPASSREAHKAEGGRRSHRMSAHDSLSLLLTASSTPPRSSPSSSPLGPPTQSTHHNLTSSRRVVALRPLSSSWRTQRSHSTKWIKKGVCRNFYPKQTKSFNI